MMALPGVRQGTTAPQIQELTFTPDRRKHRDRSRERRAIDRVFIQAREVEGFSSCIPSATLMPLLVSGGGVYILLAGSNLTGPRACYLTSPDP